ncbi:hypothetical protein HanPI659440_Chr17g0690661 [Helianthus annuus]|nr:hypothetical protein HanPI659440_Chr17g0690661 [Helianthus annuus]
MASHHFASTAAYSGLVVQSNPKSCNPDSIADPCSLVIRDRQDSVVFLCRRRQVPYRNRNLYLSRRRSDESISDLVHALLEDQLSNDWS